MTLQDIMTARQNGGPGCCAVNRAGNMCFCVRDADREQESRPTFRNEGECAQKPTKCPCGCGNTLMPGFDPDSLPLVQNTATSPAPEASWPGSAVSHGSLNPAKNSAILAGPEETPGNGAGIATPESFVDEATRIVRGNREGVYGKPTQNFETIAALWSAWLSVRLKTTVGLEAADIGHLMILMKEARLANAPRHRDSMVDIIGYSDCVDMCWRDRP